MPSPEYTSFDYHTPIHSNSMSKTRSTSPLHFLYPSFHSSASSSSYPYNDYNTASTSPSTSASPQQSSSYTSHKTPKTRTRARTRTQRNRTSPSAISSAANDVSRLLDPSYLPSSLASASGETTSTTVKAYVDTNGEMHDPDYRYFPDAVVFRRSSEPSGGGSVAKNAQRRRSGASLGSARRLGGHQQRPQFDWEKELDESALDDEEEYGGHYNYNNNNNRYTNAYTYSPTSRSWSSSTNSNSNGSNNLPSAYYSPTGTTSTLPTSYEDTEDGALSSPFDASSSPINKLSVASHRTPPSTATKPPRRRLSRGEKAREEREREKEIREMEEEQEVREMEEKMAMEEEETRRSRRRSLEMETRTSSRLARRREEQRQQQQEQHEEVVDEDGYLDEGFQRDSTRLQRDGENEKGNGEVEYVPTCGQSLRRQWQAFALSFRFGVFRAQRRMMRRVASLL